jgi:hypothetical protein
MLKGTIPVAKVDCTQDGALCDSQGVGGYPTVKMYMNKTPVDFTGDRCEVQSVPCSRLRLTRVRAARPSRW